MEETPFKALNGRGQSECLKSKTFVSDCNSPHCDYVPLQVDIFAREAAARTSARIYSKRT